ncbi:MAG: hypothetical protein IT172_06570 [Acidobacteria bacterium]|nr:hypothetical protein [Acidobacteriota bacterium]
MKFMFFEKFRAVAILAMFTVLFAASSDINAQSKTAGKKATPTKTSNKADAKHKNATSKNTKKDAAKDRSADKRSKNDDKHLANAKAKKDNPKAKRAESKKDAAERRRKEAERRAAIIEEQRRREAARREAIARKLAFERGLRTETVENIARDNTEGEDPAIRRVAINALGDHAGSVVVMEAQTGKVLTIVNQNWAVRSAIRPCSTIKLVTAAAGLNEGVISKVDGSVRNTVTRRDLDEAIAFSDNTYFQRVGAQLGNAKLVEYGHKYGLGEPTGINLDGETPGRLPILNDSARIYSHGDDTEVSTIQLAVMAAAITNGGHRVLPRIPRNTTEQTRFQPVVKAEVNLPQQNVRRMIPGMMGAAEYGTAHRGVDASQGIAGKTGSCIDKGSWVGLFTSVAPIEQPKYAVAVILRGQKERGRYAAAVAGQIYRALGSQIVRTDRNLAQTEFHLQPKQNVMNATAAKAADEEGEDDAADASSMVAGQAAQPADQDGRSVIIVPSAPRSDDKKLVQRTGDAQPLFPPVVITYSKDGTTTTITNDAGKKKRERVVKQ